MEFHYFLTALRYILLGKFRPPSTEKHGYGFYTIERIKDHDEIIGALMPMLDDIGVIAEEATADVTQLEAVKAAK